MSDLDKLIKAVESGRVVHARDENIGLDWDRRADLLAAANSGSLDAALRLHKALLPGWTRDVDATAPECGVTVTLHAPMSWPRHPDNDGAVSADMMEEARAWLLAILRALRDKDTP